MNSEEPTSSICRIEQCPVRNSNRFKETYSTLKMEAAGSFESWLTSYLTRLHSVTFQKTLNEMAAMIVSGLV
jgi:hypothetical protein